MHAACAMKLLATLLYVVDKRESSYVFALIVAGFCVKAIKRSDVPTDGWQRLLENSTLVVSFLKQP
eukprot:2053434-Pyramimonas_sp.AAC.2